MSEFDVQIAFERADDTARRLPTRREMREWMTAAASVDMDVSVRFVGLEEGRELQCVDVRLRARTRGSGRFGYLYGRVGA